MLSFVPLSLVSSVFGMNVSQISGSTQNPNIWYFFVVVIALNIGIVGALGMSNWFQMLLHRRRHPERYQALSRKPKFTDAFANALGMGDGGPR